jgi:hypothetical protein
MTTMLESDAFVAMMKAGPEAPTGAEIVGPAMDDNDVVTIDGRPVFLDAEDLTWAVGFDDRWRPVGVRWSSTKAEWLDGDGRHDAAAEAVAKARAEGRQRKIAHLREAYARLEAAIKAAPELEQEVAGFGETIADGRIKILEAAEATAGAAPALVV